MKREYSSIKGYWSLCGVRVRGLGLGLEAFRGFFYRVLGQFLSLGGFHRVGSVNRCLDGLYKGARCGSFVKLYNSQRVHIYYYYGIRP